MSMKMEKIDDCDLLPYEVIVAAVSGDGEALEEVVKFYRGNIYGMCLRNYYDFNTGNTFTGVDKHMADELTVSLMKSVIKFKL